MGSSKKQTVGHKILWGMHAVLSCGPIDKITRIMFDGKTGWSGSSEGGRIDVDAEGLFGGEKREGGVSGAIDFENGAPTQDQNDYLLARLGSMISGFRGVAALVFRQTYWGLNPYMKPVMVRAQRIHKRHREGIAQWYDEVSEVPSSESSSATVIYTEFITGWETNAPTKFQIIDGRICNTLVNASNTDYYRVAVPDFTITGFYCVFRLIDRQLGDPIGFRFDTAGGTHLLSFMPQAENAFDSLRRPHINYWTSSTPIYGSELAQGVDYSFEARINSQAGTVSYYLRQGTTLLAQGTAALPPGEPAFAVFGRSSNALPSETGIAGFSRLEIYGTVFSGDMNPAHMIREINTDPDNGLGYPDEDIDTESFTAAADTLFAEGFGLSAFWEDSKRLHEFRSEVLRHIDAAHYIDRRTGKFVLKLIRPGYDPDALPVLDESVVERVENFSRPKTDEVVNTVHVRFWDSATGNANAMASADDPALIQIQGGVIAQTIDYPWITHYELAGRVAERDLRGLSLPLATCTIYATRVAADLNEGDPFKLEWPDTGMASIIMRVTHIAYGNGRSSRVRIQAVEDRFSMPATPIQVAPPPLWENPSQPPNPVDHQITVEAPYYEVVQQLGQVNADNQFALNEFAGFLVTTGAQPGNAINASIAVDDGSGYEIVGAIDFCPFALLDEDVGPTDTVIAIRDGIDLDNVTIGTHAQIGDELVRIDAVSDTELTIGRGVLDTVPAITHAEGSKIFFWDEYVPDGDETEYAASAELDVKLLPISGSGAVVLAQATEQQITFDQRAVRPYPPGAFKIDAESYPIGIALSATTTVSWAHRDRLQQTAGTIEDTTAASIGPETGTTYTVEIRDASDDTLIDSDTAIAGTSAVFDTSAVTADALRVLLWSVRDGLDSWQAHEWVVATTAGRVTEADDDRITEDGNFRILD